MISRWLAWGGLLLWAGASQATDLSSLFSLPVDEVSSETFSASLQILFMLSLLTLLPALLMVMTSFTRIAVVLSIVRQAVGLSQTPSNQILVGLSLFLTLFIMAPIFSSIHQEAIQPYWEKKLSADQALETAAKPMRNFMLEHTRESDLQLFKALSDEPDGSETGLLTLLPAFVISELKTAFQMGFLIFIPFLIIDLVVSSVLMSMGMMMLSPLIISLPFKLMLFILVDGWSLIIGTLATSYH